MRTKRPLTISKEASRGEEGTGEPLMPKSIYDSNPNPGAGSPRYHFSIPINHRLHGYDPDTETNQLGDDMKPTGDEKSFNLSAYEQ